jgi:hypothetical protein
VKRVVSRTFLWAIFAGAGAYFGGVAAMLVVMTAMLYAYLDLAYMLDEKRKGEDS